MVHGRYIAGSLCPEEMRMFKTGLPECDTVIVHVVSGVQRIVVMSSSGSSY